MSLSPMHSQRHTHKNAHHTNPLTSLSLRQKPAACAMAAGCLQRWSCASTLLVRRGRGVDGERGHHEVTLQKVKRKNVTGPSSPSESTIVLKKGGRRLKTLEFLSLVFVDLFGELPPARCHTESAQSQLCPIEQRGRLCASLHCKSSALGSEWRKTGLGK